MGIGGNLKVICATLAVVLVVIGDVIYLREIFNKRITPHLYSWVIWTITQATASAASWYGGGGFGAISLSIGTALQIPIIFLTFKYGTKNITKGDTICLAVALSAIMVWWQMGDAWIAVLVVSSIDALGFIPTLRKSFAEPRSEAISFWLIMTIAAALIIASSAHYNFLTVFYMAVILIGNLGVWMVCLLRRRVIPGGRIVRG